MCGIVGATAERDVVPILVEGLKRLEYRGYDSAGVAVLNSETCLQRVRRMGKVKELAGELSGIKGNTGIAHTRWATHGEPSEPNAHPHMCRKTVAVVHNGIIENYEKLKTQQEKQGFEFTSATDTEVVVHLIYDYHVNEHLDLFAAVQKAAKELEGAYAIGVIATADPGRLIAARKGSPLVIGIGIGEHFIASDVSALIPVTRKFIFLEEGDIADIRRDSLVIYDAEGNVVERPVKESDITADAVERGHYRHYMLKEIYEQPRAIAETLEGRISDKRVLVESFGTEAAKIFSQVEEVHIIACGTSYHSGLIGKYWLEGLAGLPCSIEVASEFRYRKSVVRPNTLLVTISQSGETADTLAGLRDAKNRGYAFSLAICNVPESSLVRESDVVLMTRAGPEIGVASTKAFTTQLVALLLMVLALGRQRNMSAADETEIVKQLHALPGQVEKTLLMDGAIDKLSEEFADKHNALFLGRGTQYPVAMEGALKLKEISYIHAEAYPAGELKHGPLALVDDTMPIIVVAPNDELAEKLKSNLQEVRARGGQLYIFAHGETAMESSPDIRVLEVQSRPNLLAPIIFTIPLQLLAYHVAVLKGTDVDQPRNLAKSVTVE